MKHPNFFLLLILVIHTVVGLAFNLATPIFEPPDEENHYLFVRYLQAYHALPIQALDREGPRAHHPPLYFGLAALLSAWMPVSGPVERIAMLPNPKVWYRYNDPAIDNKAKWVHYTPAERWPYQGQALAVHVMRLVSLGFSTLAVWLTYLAARHLRPGHENFALLSAGLIGFNGMVLFMSGAVQNSTSAIASTAGVLYVLARFTRAGFTFTRWMWVGVALALGMLLQTSGLIMAAPIGIVLLYEAWRTRRVQALVEGNVGLLLPVLLLDGWWFARNQMLYGDWTANNTIAALWTYGPIMPPDVALYLVGTGMVGRFGQGLMLDFPNPVYVFVGLLALLALVGVTRMAWGYLRPRRAEQWLTSDFVLWSLQPLIIIAVSVSLTIYMLNYIHGVHGRYMFSAFPALALLLSAGGLSWFRPQRQTWVMVATLALSLGLSLYGLFGLLIPTYAIPRSPTASELAQMTPLDGNIGDTARVLGYSLSAEAARPGQDLAVTVYWQPLSQTDIPYTVFVHLYEPSLGSMAQYDTYPGVGNYATTVWDVGRPFVDTYHLYLPTDAPVVSGAKLLIGLYNSDTLQRLPVTGSNAGPADMNWVEFGNMQIQP